MENQEELEGVDPQPPSSTTGRGGPPRKPTETVPSDRLSFEKQIEAIKAYVAAAESHGGPVDNKQAGGIINMSENSIVVTNPFFVDVGILIRASGGGRFEPSVEAKEFVQALEWDNPQAGHKLRRLFVDKWFSKAILPRLRVRPLSLEEGCRVLAEAAGGASKQYQTNFERLVRYLDFVGLCRLEGNMIHSSSENPEKGGDEREKQDPPPLLSPTPEPQGPIIPDDAPFMFLDKKRERKVTLIAPDSLTQAEVNKIKSWLELVLFVEE